MSNLKSVTLLIWEEVPEAVRLFLRPDEVLDSDGHAALLAANGNYVNHVDVEEDVEAQLMCINCAITSEDYASSYDQKHQKWPAQWAQYEWDLLPNLPSDVVINKVVRAGFLL